MLHRPKRNPDGPFATPWSRFWCDHLSPSRMERLDAGELRRIRDACRIASCRLERFVRDPHAGFIPDNPLAGPRAAGSASSAWDRFWRTSLADPQIFFDAIIDDRERMILALDLAAERMDVALGDLHIVWGWQNTPAYIRWRYEKQRAVAPSCCQIQGDRM